MEHTFETPGPVELYVEIDRGDLSVTAVQTGQSSIRVDGDQPERLIVEQSGDRLSAVVERRSLFDFAPRLQVRATVPVGSRVLVKTGSADVATAGALAAVSVTTGSGDVEVAEATGLVRAQTGSGDVRVGSAGEVRVKSGSGDLAVGEAAGPCVVQSGSGDVEVGHAGGAATLKTASGHIRVDRADADLVTSTASGNIDLRRVRAGDQLRLRDEARELRRGLCALPPRSGVAAEEPPRDLRALRADPRPLMLRAGWPGRRGRCRLRRRRR